MVIPEPFDSSVNFDTNLGLGRTNLVSAPKPVLATLARLNSIILCANIGAECLVVALAGTDLLAILGFGPDLRQNIQKHSKAKKDKNALRV